MYIYNYIYIYILHIHRNPPVPTIYIYIWRFFWHYMSQAMAPNYRILTTNNASYPNDLNVGYLDFVPNPLSMVVSGSPKGWLLSKTWGGT